jgi:DNA-binding winged helix-turn-helix (wHTH) protein
MTTNSYARLALYRENPPLHGASRSSPAEAAAMLEFGRFRILLRRRQLVADDVPIELGTRAFDLLLVLVGADGSLVTKKELMSRVWPGIVVAEENLKVQISALRKALGEYRYFIRTEFGRGYRFTAAIRSTIASSVSEPPTRWRRSHHQRLVPQWTSLRPAHDQCARGHAWQPLRSGSQRGPLLRPSPD